MTRTGEQESIQISVLENVTTGRVSLNGRKFLVKNISGGDLTLNVKLSQMKSFVSTTFSEGWNPELVIEIESATAGQIQIGY